MSTTRDRTASDRFAIGDLDIVVRSDLPDALADFSALYPRCGGARAAGRHVIEIEVRRSGRSRLGRRRFDIHGDGEQVHADLHADEVLPHLEWAISWRIVARRSDFLQVHAASLARDGRGVMLAGPSGAGKSTLVAGLLARGWQYLCDEFALIHPATLRLHPYPKAVCIKAGSFDVVKQAGLRLSRDRHYVKALKGKVGYISPFDLGPDRVAAPCPVRYVFFPQYGGECTPRSRALPRGRAAFALLGQVLNRDAFTERAVPLLGEVVRGAACYGLETGRMDETCAMIESLVDA